MKYQQSERNTDNKHDAHERIATLASELDKLFTDALFVFMDNHCEKLEDIVGGYKAPSSEVVNAIFNVCAGFVAAQLHLLHPYCGDVKKPEEMVDVYVKLLKIQYDALLKTNGEFLA